LTNLVPNSVEDDAWHEVLAKFEDQVRKGKLQGGELVSWFRRVYPGLMKHIPTRAHTRFVEGFVEDFDEAGGLEW
jgi:hypothetical protein